MVGSRFENPKVRLPLRNGDSVVLVNVAKIAPSDEMNRNVYRVDRSGEILWQIKSGAFEGERQPFTNVYFDADGELKAYCWNGIEYPVDPNTGALGQGKLVK